MSKKRSISDELSGFELIPIGVCIIDSDYIVKYWNSQIENWTDIKKDAILNKNLLDIFPKLNKPQYTLRINNIFSGGPPVIFSSHLHKTIFENKTSTSRNRIQKTTITPFKSENSNENLGLIAVENVSELTSHINAHKSMKEKALREIEERKKIENDLRIAKEKAESNARQLNFLKKQLEMKNINLDLALKKSKTAIKAKNELLANMGHEVRTPLNGVLGMTSLALNTDLNTKQREYLEIAKKSANNLLNLLNDIIHYAKIESRKFDHKKISFNLHDCIEKVILTQKEDFSEKDLKLVCHIKPNVPLKIIGGQEHLAKIIETLISNAIKFTEKGEVVLTVSRAQSNSIKQKRSPIKKDIENINLLFTVRDTGVGIDRDKTKKIFQSFTQGDSSKTKEYGGTGMGLTIARRLVQLLNGKIWFESEEDIGTTFYFTANFKVQSYSPKISNVEEKETFKNKKILILEENQTTQKILSNYFLRSGGKVIKTKTSQEACKKISNSQSLDIILIDEAGTDNETDPLAKKIISDRDLPNTKIVLMRDSLEDEIETDLSKSDKVDAVISKRIIDKKFIAKLEEILGSGYTKKAIQSPPPPRWKMTKKSRVRP